MKYCGKCGEEMLVQLIPANLVTIMYHDTPINLDSAYNPKTGKAQYGMHLKCPNKKWYNSHDCYFDTTKIYSKDQ